MCSGNGDGRIVIGHKLSEQFSAGKHRKSLPLCFHEFFIILVNGCGVNNDINAVDYIGSLLAVKNNGTFIGEVIRERGLFVVRTGYRKSLFHEDFRKSAHADASDSDKVNMAWMIKINFIHKYTSYSHIIILKVFVKLLYHNLHMKKQEISFCDIFIKRTGRTIFFCKNCSLYEGDML